MTLSNGLGLESASALQGFDVMPVGTLVALAMKILPGNIGIENLLKRSAKGDAEYLGAEFTVIGGEFDKRKIWSNLTLDGTTAGHAQAGVTSRALLRAIYESAHGLDPKDTSPAARARLAGATLASLNGASFLATLDIEPGGPRDGGGFFKDKNVIGKVLRVGDPDYRKLDQPPPAPIERSIPPVQSQTPPPAPSSAPAAATALTAIVRPTWSQES
jgi:hypothetical protein